MFTCFLSIFNNYWLFKTKIAMYYGIHTYVEVQCMAIQREGLNEVYYFKILTYQVAYYLNVDCEVENVHYKP